MRFLHSTWVSLVMLGAACKGSVLPENGANIAERASSYWYENIAHQGVAPFAPSGYTVYRNVKDFGAKGIL